MSTATPSGGSIAAATPTVPGFLGPYLLLTRLARGGMADVFLAERAQHEGRGNYLAVKALLPKLAQRRKFVDMFHSEGKLGLMLKHPNIVETIDVGRENAIHYLVMEFIDGQDLGRILRYFRTAGAPVPLELALFTVREVLRGLEHAHDLTDEHGQPMHLVNRDVSPANIMIGYDGRVHLIDLGIAQALLNYRSQIGSIKGKVTYMSPEQVRGLALDARSDIFSLGTVFYQLLTSREPFQAPSEFEQMERVREANPPSAAEVNKRVDQELSDIVACAMSKDSALRYQSTGEMRAAVEGYARRHGLSLGPEPLAEFMRAEFAEARAKLVGEIEQARAVLAGDVPPEEDEDPTDPHAPTAPDLTAPIDAEPPAASHAPAPAKTNPRWLLPGAIFMAILALVLLAIAILRG